MLYKLLQSDDLTSSPLEIILNLAATKQFSAKILHHDNLLDYCISNKKGEILSTILSACGSPDLRQKFVLTLDGIARLLRELDGMLI